MSGVDDAEGEDGRLPWLRPVMSGAASRHTSFACFFTISTPFSHLAPTRRQRPQLLAAGVAIATGYRDRDYAQNYNL